jgi:hypothetical protein
MIDEKPVGSVEVELVHKMAEHTWLRERAARCQEACFVVMPQTSEQKKNDQAEVLSAPSLNASSAINRTRTAPISVLLPSC